MNYSLVISPDLRIDAEEFSVVWNQDPKSRDIAQAKSVGANTEKYIWLDPELVKQGVVFLAGAAGTITLDVVKDLIKDRIMKILAGRSGAVAGCQIYSRRDSIRIQGKSHVPKVTDVAQVSTSGSG